MAPRRHAAPGGRALATGLTVSATFGIVAGFAAHQPAPVDATIGAADTAPTATLPTPEPTPVPTTPTTPDLAAAPPTAAPRTTIVTRVVHRRIEVDEAAPQPGVFQRGHPAEPPHAGLAGVGDPVGVLGDDRPPGDGPDRHLDACVGERLHEQRRRQHPGGYVGRSAAGGAGQGQQ